MTLTSGQGGDFGIIRLRLTRAEAEARKAFVNLNELFRKSESELAAIARVRGDKDLLESQLAATLAERDHAHEEVRALRDRVGRLLKEGAEATRAGDKAREGLVSAARLEGEVGELRSALASKSREVEVEVERVEAKERVVRALREELAALNKKLDATSTLEARLAEASHETETARIEAGRGGG